jgi:hypothetical protein
MRVRWSGSFISMVLSLALTVSACGNDAEPSSAAVVTEPTSAVATTTTPATTAAPVATTSTTTVSTTTPVAPTSTTTALEEPTTTTTAAPTTTVAPEVAALSLRPDGVGGYRFGSAIIPVIDALVAVLGDPISDAAWEYPTEFGEGRLDAFGDFSFPYEFGRQTCFANEFCVEAGGPESSEMTFVGWTQSEGPESLVTTLGITIGSVWSDNARVMSVDEGGCLSFGTGASGGIDLQLQSSGALFSAPDGSGGYTIGEPEPADVMVVGLSAGDLRTFMYGDC